MSDVTITIQLSEELLERVKAIGLEVKDLPALIEAQLEQREANRRRAIQRAAEIMAALDQIQPSLSLHEIDEAIRKTP